ncbi:hypothetical protein WJX72_001577 [[Myrmecia] bisecta]|uniref:Uncharacterized protein n=1 Tax=[Myrmecia] bisecta TaxID=41462 RepID=A0AAW1Q211_9CHLO
MANAIVHAIHKIPVQARTARMARLLEQQSWELSAGPWVSKAIMATVAADYEAAYVAAYKAVDLAAAADDEQQGAAACYLAAELLMIGGAGPTFHKKPVCRLLEQAHRYEATLSKYTAQHTYTRQAEHVCKHCTAGMSQVLVPAQL